MYGVTSLSTEVPRPDLERLVRGPLDVREPQPLRARPNGAEDRGQMHRSTPPEALTTPHNSVLTAQRQTGRWAYIPDAVCFCAASPDHAFALLGIGRL